MKKHLMLVVGVLLFGFFLKVDVKAQTAVSPAVQAILFYSPTCPHCHLVINDLLVPMQEQYGDQLQILGVDVSKPGGSLLFVESLKHFGWPPDQTGVPTLIVDDTVLNGSLEIPEKFPGIVEEGLAAGGIGWPDIPGLQEMVPDLPPSAAPQPAAEVPTETAVESEETAVSGIQTGVSGEMASSNHPVEGAGLAWLVMALMVAAIGYTGYRSLTASRMALKSPAANQTAIAALLIVIGLIVAGYLAYVETTQTLAVCGPVGDCNTVQTSPYATILGIPVAILGLINYLAVGLLWFVQSRVREAQRPMVWLGLMALTFVGTIFSIYLTTLELFVIRAVCAWCLTSAVVTALLLVLANSLIEDRQAARQRYKFRRYPGR